MAIAPEQIGIGIGRYFTRPGTHPYDTVEWERREARIQNYKDGTDAFLQPDVEFPIAWSQNATNIVAQKYFRGTLGTPERETSLRQVIDRIADTITAWGVRDGYFVDDQEGAAFRNELKHILLTQRAAFNSPVWFNIGVKGERQQASACQPYDALVSTVDGPVPIGELVDERAIDTKVFDAHGVTRIVAVKANGHKEVLRVHTKSALTLDVTPDHLVWRGRRGEGSAFAEAGTLRPGDRLEWHRVESWGVDETSAPEIDRIESLGAMDVFDIQTESGEYLSNNLRVHNCFILAVEDTMDGILNWYREEGVIFKGGSGSGINLSSIRSSRENLAGGGTASGPVSFMRGADASAGTIKSGGKTRRAAKMAILNADHPDIEEFIWCKAVEERKARALRDAGFDMDLDGRDSYSIQYQNANNSVRVTDEFMQAVLDDRDWALAAVTSGETIKTVKARDLMRQISEAAWECADPGMQFDTTINRWHTASNTGRINGSNPCSEYMHLDNSACNLASINLLKYLDEHDNFDVEAFKHTVEVMFTAQEILVGNADYPTEKIADTSRKFRQLGLGYANVGALLMALGLPYDSDGGRAWAGAITALMTGHAYATSARTAGRMGPFAGYADNAEPMMDVLRMHRAEAAKIDEDLVPPEVLGAAQQAWDEAVELGERFGVRNSQATVLAPTGTIGLALDCDTTGIEPDLALTKAKKLVGGGTMFIVNQTIPRALQRLGYTDDQIDAIVHYIDDNKTIVGAPDFDPEHLPVFACSMGDNAIHYMGHVTMMGAVQPFISGAISKTVNMPEDVTVGDVEQLHIDAWELGIKAIAIYRDNCKVAQPLATQKKAAEQAEAPPAEQVERIVEHVIVQEPVRQKLPRTRNSKTFSFRVADCRGFATVAEYEDGRPGELFLNVSKQGSTLAGIMDSFAIAVSHGLQYGVPLRAFVETFTNRRFEPAGMTDDPDIRIATSLVDYIFRKMAVEYLPYEERAEIGVLTTGERMQPTLPGVEEAVTSNEPLHDELPLADQPPSASLPPPGAGVIGRGTHEVVLCHVCGDIMQRAGSCHACPSCGATSGCS
ncbi:MAG TPA: vitamin B12-dependent ribonucleotide reductase [Acidimicrobiia bacterium]|nr:vitamin B12-dependent ribonucleotide reductase [Acidimicrobiia bacterium]